MLKGKTMTFRTPENQTVVEAMKREWVRNRKLCSNPALEHTWLTISRAFQEMAHTNSGEFADDSRGKVVVIPAPTGAGKTTSIYQYFAACDVETIPATLIVVRMKEDAENLAKGLNELLGQEVAGFHHSDKPKDYDGLVGTKILTICHASYEKALQEEWEKQLLGETSDSFDKFLRTEGGFATRPMIIIDEEFELITTANVSAYKGNNTLGLNLIETLPYEIIQNFQDEFFVVNALKKYLETTTQDKETAEGLAGLFRSAFFGDVAKFLPLDLSEAVKDLRFNELQQEVAKLDFALAYSIDNQSAAKRKLEVLSILRELLVIQHTNTNFTSREGNEATLNAATSIIPEGIKMAVVLDATGNINELYHQMNGVEVVALPDNIRNYQNLTIKVARMATGRSTLSDTPSKMKKSVEMLKSIDTVEVKGRPSLVITHKDTATALSRTRNLNSEVAWWGAIDGKNDWKDCPVVILYGLNHKRDTYYKRRALGATGGISSWKEEEQSDLSVEVVQAIARGAIRKPIDNDGNCQPCEAFLTLPKGSLGDAILNTVISQFPNCSVVDWKLPQPAKATKQSLTANEKKFVRAATKLKAKTSFAKVVELAKLTKRQGEVFKSKVEDTTSELYKALQETGVAVSTTKHATRTTVELFR